MIGGSLPLEYDRALMEEELRKIRQEFDTLKSIKQWVPLTNSPAAPLDGMVAYADGTTEWVSGSGNVAGLHRYNLATTAWVLVG